MNEKILEFAKQTGLCDAEGDFFGGKISQYDEFAELIVRECAEVSKNYASGSMPLSIGLAIKQHFGVEQ